MEFGCQNDKKILFVHGAGTSYKMWTAQIEMLSDEYHLYVVTLNGHAIGEPAEYQNPVREAKDLLDWFDKHEIEKIHLIVGASLGAYVATEVLRLRPDFAEYAFIESLKSYHYGKFLTWLFRKTGGKMLRKAASVEGVMEGSYGKDYISDDMKYVLSNISEQSLQNVLLTAANYRIAGGKRSITAKTLIVYGSKEAKLCKENTELLSQQIIDCQCSVLEGFDHGELAIGNPEKHVEMMRMWMKNGMLTKGESNE